MVTNRWAWTADLNRLIPRSRTLVISLFPGLPLVASQQSPEEAPRTITILFSLNIHIHHFTVLINGSPQIVLFAAYLHEDLINEKCIAITPMFTFQPPGVFGAKLVAPQANRFVADGDSSLCEYIFDISVT